MVSDIAGKSNGVDGGPAAGEADKSDARMTALEEQMTTMSAALGIPPVASEAPVAEPTPAPAVKEAAYSGFEDIMNDLDDVMQSFGDK